jgi:hypothetical protein
MDNSKDLNDVTLMGVIGTESFTYITSYPFPFGVGRDHFFPLATILTHLSLLSLSSNSTYMLAGFAYS